MRQERRVRTESNAISGEVDATNAATEENDPGETTTAEPEQSTSGNSTVQSLPVESATEHDTGFLLDSIEAGPAGLQTTPRNIRIGDITDDDMQFNPPRHPLVTEQFRRRFSASTDSENVASPGSSPDFSQPRRMAFGRGGGLPLICKVEVNMLPEGDDDDQNSFHTPGPTVTEHHAEEVDLVGANDDEEATPGYIVHSNEGDVTVLRVSEEEADDEGEQSPNDVAGSSAPSGLPPPPQLPAPEKQHELQGKVRASRKTRFNPIEHPRSNQPIDDPLARRRAQALAQQRDASGRFRAKGNSEQNPSNQ